MALSYFSLAVYQRKLQKLGFHLARHQKVILIISLIMVALSCSGYMRMQQVNSADGQFELRGTQSRKNLEKAAWYFALLGARREEMILESKSGGNILNQDCLAEAALIHSAVIHTSEFQERCVQQSAIHENKHVPNSSCVFLNPLELVGFQRDQLPNLSSIIVAEMETPKKTLANGRTFAFSARQMLGDLKYENGNTTVSARALRMIYYVNPPKNRAETLSTLNMEKILASQLASLGSQLKCASLSFMVDQMPDATKMIVLGPKQWPLILCIAGLFAGAIFLTFLLGFSNWLVVPLLALFCVVLALVCSVGIVSLAGLPFSPSFWFLPYLLQGNGFTVALLVSKELERRSVASTKSQVGGCLAKIGLLLVASTVTDLVLFGIAISSSYTGMAFFFLVALVAVFFIFLFLVILFLPLVIAYMKNKKSQTPRCLLKANNLHRPRGSSESSTEAQRLESVSLTMIIKAYGQALTSLYGKVLVFSLIAVALAFSIFYASRSAHPFNTSLSFDRGPDMRDFEKARAQFFEQEVDVSLVLYDNVDYSSTNVQNQILQMSQSLSQASYSARPASSWMTALTSWAKDMGIICNGEAFYPCLLEFLKKTQYFRQDVRFKHQNSSITASRLHLYMKMAAEFSSGIKGLKTLQEDLKNEDNISVDAVSEVFIQLEELAVFKKDSLLILCTVTAVIFVCGSLFTLNPWISFLLASVFILHFLEAAGIMYIWDVPINQLSFLAVFTGMVVSLNFSIYITQTFVISSKKAARDGVVSALTSCGPPVLLGGILTIVGSVGLGFTFVHLADIFHCVLPLVITLGLVHALVILPPLLSLKRDNMWYLTIADWTMSKVRSQEYHMKYSAPSGFETCRPPKHPSISIIGIGCTFPQANSKNDFWGMLISGRCGVSEDFTPNRPQEYREFHKHYHPKKFVSGRLPTLGGAYLEDIRGFDAKFFGISAQEACSMDPQQRILLQVIYEAIEDAGLRLEDLQNCKTGVFLGSMNLDYGHLITSGNLNKLDQFASTGNAAAILANRVSFCLNLTGPSLSVDTACSSSLTALKLACDNLHKGSCEVAIVCAPNIVLNHKTQVQ